MSHFRKCRMLAISMKSMRVVLTTFRQSVYGGRWRTIPVYLTKCWNCWSSLHRLEICLHSTLFYSTVLNYTLLYSILLYPTFFYSTVLYSTLLYSIGLYVVQKVFLTVLLVRGGGQALKCKILLALCLLGY